MELSQLEKIKSLRLAYKKTFESEEGKKVLEDLKRRCFYDKPTFVGDINVSAFNEGTRSVVLLILENMKDREGLDGSG